MLNNSKYLIDSLNNKIIASSGNVLYHNKSKLFNNNVMPTWEVKMQIQICIKIF